MEQFQIAEIKLKNIRIVIFSSYEANKELFEVINDLSNYSPQYSYSMKAFTYPLTVLKYYTHMSRVTGINDIIW